MSLWSRIANALRGGDRINREIDEELQTHIDEAIAHGRDAARVQNSFGSALRHREASRDIRALAWLDSLRADAIFGLRRLMQTKVTSAAAILSLALAIGACTSAFRLIDALLLRPLPIAHPERLYVVAFSGIMANTGKPLTYDSSSYPMFRQMKTDVQNEADLVAASYADRTDLTYGSDEEMEKGFRQFVSGDMFQMFGLQPAAGRLFTSHDDTTPGAHPVAVISYDYWTRRFGRDPSALGRTMRVDDNLFEIVGVAPEGFTGTETGTLTDIFFPMMMKRIETLTSWNNFWMRTLVELKPGVAAQPVRDRLAATFHSIQVERLKSQPYLTKPQRDHFFDEKLVLESAASGRSNLQREYRQALEALSVLVGLVLLIACANLANLMTARATARSREMALRVSIGAGRFRLIQLVLIESAWVAFLATVAGAVFAWWSAPFIIAMINSPDNPARLLLPADWRVLAFSLALTLAVTFLFGLPPALRASNVKPSSALKGGEDPHSRRRLMHVLIAAQVAFCFVVLFVAGLFVSSFDRLSRQPLGYSPDRIINLETLTRRPQLPVYWDQVVDHLRRMPGVTSVAMSPWPVMSGETSIGNVSAHGGPASDVFSDTFAISPGWIETMKIPLLSGRDLRPSDVSPGAVIVNQSFTRQFFSGDDPIGKSFEQVDSKGTRTRFEIVGLVPDARYRDNLRLPIRPTFYPPINSANPQGEPRPRQRGTFVVQTSGADPLALASILRSEVSRANSEFRVSNIRTQNEIIESKTIRERLLAMLAMFFACVALLLAAVGLYGVLDYSVLQQRREIGIRIAIGARTADVIQKVTVSVFAMVILGAIAGLGLGMISVRYIEAILYQA
ncbi:MAG TPA: ABC transporter permease [Bryobacteraceae bacterium]